MGNSCGVAAIRLLAAVLPELSGTEGRVLVEIWRRCQRASEARCYASTREIAASTGCGRRAVQQAIAGLLRRGLITAAPGSVTQSASFGCKFEPAPSIPTGRREEAG